eukprot:847618_1
MESHVFYKLDEFVNLNRISGEPHSWWVWKLPAKPIDKMTKSEQFKLLIKERRVIAHPNPNPEEEQPACYQLGLVQRFYWVKRSHLLDKIQRCDFEENWLQYQADTRTLAKHKSKEESDLNLKLTEQDNDLIEDIIRGMLTIAPGVFCTICNEILCGAQSNNHWKHLYTHLTNIG